jgi:hypothetical protein
MALGQNTRVVAEPRPSKICDSFCGSRTGVRLSLVTKSLTFFVWDEHDEGEHQDPYSLKTAVGFHCCPPR